MTMNDRPETRTLALEITETEWKALMAIEPDAIAWLRSVIHTRLAPPAPERLEFDQFDAY